MCRWITLISSRTVSLSDLILSPSNSLVHQSRDATYHPGYGDLNNSPMNGDGFGVGWYHTNTAVGPKNTAPAMDGTRALPGDNTNGKNREETRKRDESPTPASTPTTKAAVFKDTFPAWSNENLRELCMATSSDCIVAHVRAASLNTGISRQNCHPFKAGRLLFCHNGRIHRMSELRRKMLNLVTDEAFNSIRGTTDSEAIFAIILTLLAKDGTTSVSPLEQTAPFGAKRLVAALKKTLWTLETLSLENGITDGYSTLNFSITDGETMVVTRFCDRAPQVPPPSLYFVFGESEALHKELTKEEQLIAISSPGFVSQASDIDLDSSIEQEKAETSSQDSASDSTSAYKELFVSLDHTESKPGRILTDVDPTKASFIVTSNPLTAGHVWHKMPQNSIMWCTRGEHPELRLLTKRKSRYSVIELAN